MANIVIKKTINLGFLGKEYEDSSLTFKSLSIQEYEAWQDKIDAVGDNGKEALKVIIEILSKQFISGTFQGESVVKDDLKQLDFETLNNCFQLFTGSKTDPKD